MVQLNGYDAPVDFSRPYAIDVKAVPMLLGSTDLFITTAVDHIALVGSGAFTLGANDSITGGTINFLAFHDDRVTTDSFGLSSLYIIDNMALPVDVVSSFARANNAAGLYSHIFHGDDQLNGSQYSDLMYGYDGNDVVMGGIGNDNINGNQGFDAVLGGDGHDAVFGGRQDDLVRGDEGNDLVSGNMGLDTVIGGLGDDYLYGGQDADSLHGEDGDDLLSGDRGSDVLTGGAGIDRFFFAPGGGTDIITDFAKGVDKLVISWGFGPTADRINQRVVDGDLTVQLSTDTTVIFDGLTDYLSFADILVV